MFHGVLFVNIVFSEVEKVSLPAAGQTDAPCQGLESPPTACTTDVIMAPESVPATSSTCYRYGYFSSVVSTCQYTPAVQDHIPQGCLKREI